MRKLIVLFMLISGGAFANNTLIIADTLYWEARGESVHGQLAVASVIVNRASERRLSPTQVCQQYKQFSCWNSHPTPRTYDSAIFERCMFIAIQIERGSFIPMGNWNHYYNPHKCSPSWASDMYNIRIIGNHKFGKI